MTVMKTHDIYAHFTQCLLFKKRMHRLKFPVKAVDYHGNISPEAQRNSIKFLAGGTTTSRREAVANPLLLRKTKSHYTRSPTEPKNIIASAIQNFLSLRCHKHIYMNDFRLDRCLNI